MLIDQNRGDISFYKDGEDLGIAVISKDIIHKELYPFVQMHTNLSQVQIFHGYVFPDEVVEDTDIIQHEREEEEKEREYEEMIKKQEKAGNKPGGTAEMLAEIKEYDDFANFNQESEDDDDDLNEKPNDSVMVKTNHNMNSMKDKNSLDNKSMMSSIGRRNENKGSAEQFKVMSPISPVKHDAHK